MLITEMEEFPNGICNGCGYAFHEGELNFIPFFCPKCGERLYDKTYELPAGEYIHCESNLMKISEWNSKYGSISCDRCGVKMRGWARVDGVKRLDGISTGGCCEVCCENLCCMCSGVFNEDGVCEKCWTKEKLAAMKEENIEEYGVSGGRNKNYSFRCFRVGPPEHIVCVTKIDGKKIEKVYDDITDMDTAAKEFEKYVTDEILRKSKEVGENEKEEGVEVYVAGNDDFPDFTIFTDPAGGGIRCSTHINGKDVVQTYCMVDHDKAAERFEQYVKDCVKAETTRRKFVSCVKNPDGKIKIVWKDKQHPWDNEITAVDIVNLPIFKEAVTTLLQNLLFCHKENAADIVRLGIKHLMNFEED